MNALRIAVLFVCGLGATLVTPAAERTGPSLDDVIYPRGSTATAAQDASATDAEKQPKTDAELRTSSSGDQLAERRAEAGAQLGSGGMMPAMGYLVAFGALIGGAWFLLRRGTLGRPFAKSEGKLRVLETKMLGNRQFLMVVEYDDAKMLLGVCPGKIDYLTPLAGHPLATGASGVTALDDEPAAIAFPPTEVRR